jgi:hypothetical protein
MRKYKTNNLNSKVAEYDIFPSLQEMEANRYMIPILYGKSVLLNRAFVLLKQIFVLLLPNKFTSS